jgi:hypothetical protein
MQNTSRKTTRISGDAGEAILLECLQAPSREEKAPWLEISHGARSNFHSPRGTGCEKRHLCLQSVLYWHRNIPNQPTDANKATFNVSLQPTSSAKPPLKPMSIASEPAGKPPGKAAAGDPGEAIYLAFFAGCPPMGLPPLGWRRLGQSGPSASTAALWRSNCSRNVANRCGSRSLRSVVSLLSAARL